MASLHFVTSNIFKHLTF